MYMCFVYNCTIMYAHMCLHVQTRFGSYEKNIARFEDSLLFEQF